VHGILKFRDSDDTKIAKSWIYILKAKKVLLDIKSL
jgi:hypothetical protein